MSPPKKTWRLVGRANFRSARAAATQDERDPHLVEADAHKARQEWTSLVETIRKAGGEVLVLPPHPSRDLTGLIYTAEAGTFVQPMGAMPHLLLPLMKPPHRRPEATWIAQVAAIHYRWIASKYPTSEFWEAQGDLLYLDPHTAIMTYGEGEYARTTSEGLRVHASGLADESIFLKFKANPWFHGNTFINVYHHATDPSIRLVMLASDALFPHEEQCLRRWLAAQDDRAQTRTSIFTISKEESLAYATNALQVGRTIIAPAGVPARCKQMWRETLGLDVIELDLEQLFLRGGGAPVCLTCKLLGLSPEQAPSRFLWRDDSTIEDFEALV